MRLQMPLQGAHPKTTVRNQPLERSQVNEDHLPKLSWGASKVQKLSTTVKNFSTRARDGKTLPALVSMVIPRYFAVCEGTRSDFFSFITIPRVRQSERSYWTGRFGLLLRGGEDQPVVQIPEKSDPVGMCPR